LFTPACLCRCRWSNIGLVTFTLWFESFHGSCSSKLEQVAILPCTQLSLQPSAGWEMSSSLWATEWRLSVADWCGGMSASCKPRVQLFADAAMDARIVRCGIINVCQSAATSEIAKRFWSRVWLM